MWRGSAGVCRVYCVLGVGFVVEERVVETAARKE